MANRYGRDIGRRDREGFENERYGRRSSGWRPSGSSPFDEDESYFGGSRRFGEGYSGNSPRDFDTYGGGFGRLTSDWRDRGYSGREGRERGFSGGREGYGQGRYRQGNENSQEYGREWRERYSDRGGYSDSWTGGRQGGYSDRSGYGGGGGGGGGGSSYSPRYEDRWGAGDYPSSERGYAGGYDDTDERGWWEKTSDEVASWFGDDDAARRRRMDTRPGGHRGRGPSGYTRSDDRIREDINDRLTDYDYIDATNISVEVQGGDVVLTGTVESRYEKRLAEDIAEDVSGVRNVENRLRVQNSQTYGQSSGISASTETTTGTTGTTGTAGGSGSASSNTQAKGKTSSGS